MPTLRLSRITIPSLAAVLLGATPVRAAEGASFFRQLAEWSHLTLFEIGATPVTAFGLLRVLIIWLIAWWLAKLASLALSRIAAHREDVISPASLYVLSRVVHYLILVVGLVVGLSSIGLDFSNFALLAGALGVGIGFGLQNMVNNFSAGLFILFEKSLKKGDFVELESGVVGEVREINFRNTRITTNDNIDILVPNAEFMNGRVTNWTLDDSFRRIHVPFGVAYGSDKELVKKAGLEAAGRVIHTLQGVHGREPGVWLVRFGESSLDFELVVWLTPAAVKRPAAVMADYLWAIHSALQEHRIEIPFPQRDLHLKSFFGLAGDEARRLAQPAAGSTDR